jgi:hypothetical protein
MAIDAWYCQSKTHLRRLLLLLLPVGARGAGNVHRLDPRNHCTMVDEMVRKYQIHSHANLVAAMTAGVMLFLSDYR